MYTYLFFFFYVIMLTMELLLEKSSKSSRQFLGDPRASLWRLGYRLKIQNIVRLFFMYNDLQGTDDILSLYANAVVVI